MNNDVKKLPVNMEDLEAYSKVLHNKGIGNIGTCSTAAATKAKTVTFGTTFSLVTGAMVIVTFTNGISVGEATLTVGEGEVKDIYLKGEALEANIIKAGDSVIMRYNGTQWDIIGGVGSGTAEVEIGSETPLEDVKLFVDEDEDPANAIDIYNKTQVDTLLGAKADKTATVSSVTYDSAANMLRQTINGVTTNITPIVQSGFVPQFNGTTGIMELDSVGGATIAPNSTTGIIEMTF